VVIAGVLQVPICECSAMPSPSVARKLMSHLLQSKRVQSLPEQVVLSMYLTDTQISETADFVESSLHLPKASTAPQQQ